MKITDNRGVGRPTAARPAAAGVSAYAQASAAAGAVRGQDSVTLTMLGIPEAEMTPKVRQAIMMLMEEAAKMRKDLEIAQRRLAEMEQLADQDSLTPLANRRAFVRELSRMSSFSERYGVSSSLIFFDLNDLKVINDTHGHAAGDAALMHVAHILVANVRDSDVVGRLGGDEFGVILAQADEKVATEKAEHLAGMIRRTPLDWNGIEITLDTAHGLYSLRGGEDPSRVIAQADQAMYARKRGMKAGA